MSKLHLGCGAKILPGYINTDIEDWSGKCDYVVDARDLSIFEDNSFEEVYSRQMLEHIQPYDTEQVLKEMYRVLQPGGKVKISVPDVERICIGWLVDKTVEENEALNNIWGTVYEGGKRFARREHKTGFTFERLSRLLKEADFVNVKRIDDKYLLLVVEAIK